MLKSSTAPRHFGVALVYLGIGMLVIGIGYHVVFMLGLRRERLQLKADGLIHAESQFPASLTLIALPFVAEKTTAAFCTVVCAPGTLFTGARFVCVTAMLTVLVADFAPPTPDWPRSLLTKISESEPLKYCAET